MKVQITFVIDEHYRAALSFQAGKTTPATYAEVAAWADKLVSDELQKIVGAFQAHLEPPRTPLEPET